MLGAKFLGTIAVGIVAMFIALVVGVLGTVVGSAIAGVDPVWNVSAAEFGLIVLGSVLGMLFGFMLGLLVRNSAGAIVTYFVHTLVLPPLLGLLAANQQQLAVPGGLWFLLPMVVGLLVVRRTEGEVRANQPPSCGAPHTAATHGPPPVGRGAASSGLVRTSTRRRYGVAMATGCLDADTGDMQSITFTPSPAVCRRVSACAGPVELVEETHDRCLHEDHSRIYRVRSLLTGDTCWAYLGELTVEISEVTLEDAA